MLKKTASHLDTILIIDDHPVFTYGLNRIIASIWPKTTVLTAKSCRQAKHIINEVSAVDCIFIDYNLPDNNGIQFIEELREMKNMSPTVLLTSENSIALIHRAFESGSSGFLLKSATKEDYQHCLDTIFNGKRHLDNKLIEQLVNYRRTTLVKMNSYKNNISQRQSEILIILKKGFSNKEISEMLGISIRTLKAELTYLYELFKVNNRNHCVSKAMQEGII